MLMKRLLTLFIRSATGDSTVGFPTPCNDLHRRTAIQPEETGYDTLLLLVEDKSLQYTPCVGRRLK